MPAMSKSSNIIRLDNKHACPRTCFGYMFTLVMLPSSSVVPDILRKKEKRGCGRMWRSYISMVVMFHYFAYNSELIDLKKKNLNCGPYKLNIYPIS